jgi:ABC-type glutathione transport system ATPase component
LSASRHEFVAVLGPSGAGKTTLFRCITGLLAADQGTVRIGMSQVTSVMTRRLRDKARMAMAVSRENPDLAGSSREAQLSVRGLSKTFHELDLHRPRLRRPRARSRCGEEDEALSFGRSKEYRDRLLSPDGGPHRPPNFREPIEDLLATPRWKQPNEYVQCVCCLLRLFKVSSGGRRVRVEHHA